MLELCLDFVRDNLRHREGKNSLLNGEKKHYPVVSVRSVLELPFFQLSIPLVSASASLSNLDMVDRRSPLLFIDVSPSFDRICKHFLTNPFFKREFQLLHVIFDLLRRDTVIHALVHGC